MSITYAHLNNARCPAPALVHRLDPHVDTRVIKRGWLGSADEVCDRDRGLQQRRRTSRRQGIESAPVSASHLLEVEVFPEQAGTDAELPQLSARRGLAAESPSVTASERVPAETVSQLKCAKNDRPQLGGRELLRFVPKACGLARSLLIYRHRLQVSDSKRQLTGDVLLRHLHRRLTLYSTRPNALISSSSWGDSSRGTSPRATFAL
jgi:hypothetical protein